MTKELFDQFRQITNFPEKWRLVELNELIYDLRGGSPLEPEDFIEKGFPVLHKGAIKPFGEIEIDPKKKAFTHDAFVKKYLKPVVNREYIAVTLRDLVPSEPSIGLISTLYSSSYPEYILAQGAYAFLVNKKLVIPEYLVWLSNTDEYRKFIRTLAVGSTQIHVRTPIFTSIPIPLPPLPEQKRIVAILEKCDRLRRTRRYSLQLSETFLQSVFLEMFGNLETNSKNWNLIPFDDVCTIDAEMVDPKLPEFCNLLHIGAANIESITGNILNLQTAGQEKLISSKFLINPEHILFSKIRPKLRKVAFPQIHGLCSADVYPIRIKSFSCNQYFLLHFFRSNYFSNLVSGLAESRTNIPKINREELSEQSIPLPPLPLQEKFAQIVQKHDRFRTQQREA
ncbi:MAG: hypothetical protein HEQ27_15775 [Dolichospermum sp. JUN01]|nr:hypothetical protein [Dolichospermum sp. JUN01]